MGKREINRLLKKNIFLPNPNDLGILELSFEGSLSNPFRDESLNWMDLQRGKSYVFSFLGSKSILIKYQTLWWGAIITWDGSLLLSTDTT